MCIKKLYNILARLEKVPKIKQKNKNMSKSITKLTLFSSLANTLMLSQAFFLALYLKYIGFSGIQIGILFATSSIITIASLIPSGLSNDTHKSKNLITIALIFLGIHFIGIAQTNSFGIMFILFLIEGIGSSFYNVSSDSLFYKISNNSNMNKKIGIYQGIKFLMNALGIMATGYFLNTNINFETMFTIVGIIFLVLAIISQTSLPESATAKFALLHYKKDLAQKKALFLVLIIFLFAIHFGAEQTSYGLFLQNNLQLDKFQMGLYMGAAVLIMGPTSFLISKKLKFLKAKNLLLFGLLGSGLFHILMTIKNPGASFFFRTMHEIADASMFFFFTYGISKIFHIKRIGGNLGIIYFAIDIGTTLGALVFGPIGMTYGYQWPLIISGITTLTAFLVASTYIHHFDHK